MLRTAARLVIIFILVFAGVKMWYNRLEDSVLTVPVPEKTAVEQLSGKTAETPRKQLDYSVIVDRNIFQAALTDVVDDSVVVEELEPTKLKLALMGTVSGDKDDSRAIISDEEKKKQDIYRVGDTIQGAQIKAIERGRVVLRVNGKNEVLNIKDRKGGGPGISTSQPSSMASRRSLSNRLQARTPTVRPAPRRPARPMVRSPAIRTPNETEETETAEDDRFLIPGENEVLSGEFERIPDDQFEEP